MLRLPRGSAVKNPPAVQELQETWVRSLGQEDPLEESIATQSSFFAWEIPWTEEPGGLQSIEPQRVRHNRSDLALFTKFWLLLQTFYVENYVTFYYGKF